jgi:hypothetical protein
MTVRRLQVVFVMVLSALVGSASPATALSCVRHPDNSHLAIAAGSFGSSGDREFFERWHHLLLGRVVGVTTDEDERSPTWGRTTWAVEVAAALGEGEVPRRVEVAAQDAGGYAGYAFTVGDAFAIPVWDIEELGFWSSFACDPISPLGDLDGSVDEVLAVASAHGTPISSVGNGATGTAGGGPWAAAATLAAAMTGGATLVLWRRRRQFDHRHSAR